MPVPPLRVGLGIDAHRFAAPGERPLVLGGLTIDHPRGLEGHSDADVLYHAVGDAILGALALGDLGHHFPDSDPALRGVDSSRILAAVVSLAADRGWVVANVDTVIVAQEPRIAPHVPRMRANLGRLLGLPAETVSIKATTTEHMGFTGRGEGIAATAIVLLARREGGS